MHEHLADLAPAVVRLDLSEADRAILLDRRQDPHSGELAHLSRLDVERLRLGVFAEILTMPEIAKLAHEVVVDLDQLAADLWKRAPIMEQVDERVGHPPALAELAHHAVGHGDRPLDEAVSAAAELTVGCGNHLSGLH